jgi:integrase
MAREARKLRKSTLDNLRKQAQESPDFTAYVADAGQPGLYAWARRGKVRFVFAYRPPGGGRRKRIKIDDYGAISLDQAREAARKLRGQVAERKDPQLERLEEARKAVTVEDGVRRYLEDLKERAESGAKRGRRSGYASAKNRLERHVVPKLGRTRLRNVTVEQVSRLHRSLKDTPIEANRTLTALSAVFGYADRIGLVSAHFNPCRHVTRFEENGERRALTAEELEALGKVMREAEEKGSVPAMEKGRPKMRKDKPVRAKVSPSALLAIRLIALTGMRRSEVLGHESRMRRGGSEGLRWGEVDLEAGTIRLRDSKTGAQTRVIGQAAIDLLRSALPEVVEDDDPICPGAHPGQPFIGVDRPRIRIFEAAGLSGLDLHSLRHTFASVGAHVQNGRFAAFVGPLLGHGYQKRSITERYIHSNPEALRPAADAIAGSIAKSLGMTEPARVLAFQA